MSAPNSPPPVERFLVVDDDPSITEALTKVVKSMGFEVISHTDPREAARETAFDLIITDFMMPHMSGVELLNALRATRPEAVRLLITAANDFKVAMKAVNEGEVFKLLGKPWGLNELRSAITQAVDYHRLLQDNKRLTLEVSERNAQLTALNATLEQQVTERTTGLLEGMIRALDYRDTETQWHSWRVARFTRRIAEAMGIAGEQLVQIEQGALLHDIGKIGVRDAILLKPGPLSPEEWVEMKKHPELGYRMLANIPYLQPAADIVFQHQEKWNGQGYPRGLKGEEITIGARLFCIADTMDAICSDRPYRKGSTLEVAIMEIGRLAGSQFDPKAVETFLAIPPTEWVRIRQDIEHLEQVDKRRATGEFPVVKV
ncbi:MAG: HD domain-containing phosphohydrolase [Archangium sp.]|nr:HD domain-containing phosphohydrolase [Archangium sp.]MDP3155555.1 HD domain-containing phosphohydrolase [Archangium sp.]MDP3570839.1 HD domain-containing phosphohydrolase [Archangium sp.]